MRPVNYETRNLFVNFSVWSERLRRAGALPAGVALAVLFALSAPSAQAKVDKITIAAIDDVVAGDEGWIIAIDDVAADAGGWITAIDEAAGAGGGIAVYAAGAGGGIAAFGQVEVEARLFGEDGRELFPEDFPDGKIPTGKPDERTTEFPSSKDTPTITDAPGDATGVISFATSSTSLVEGGTANVEIHLSKPAPIGGIKFDITVGGKAVKDGDIEDPKSIFIPEGESVVTVPIVILDDADRENEIVSLYLFNGYQLPYGWEFSNNNKYHHLTIVDNDVPNPFEYPEDETPVAEKPDEDTAIDDTAINPNGEPPSNENTPTIINDLADKPDDSNETEENPLVDDSDHDINNDRNRVCFSSSIENRGCIEMQTSQTSSDGTTTRADYNFSRGAIKHQQPINYRAEVFGEIINPQKRPGIFVRVRSFDDESNITLTNRAKISDANIGIDVLLESIGDINISNNGEIWDVRKFGIRAVHKGRGDINIVNTGDIKYIGGTGTGLSIVNGYGIRARHRGTGNINIDIGGSVEVQQEDRSPVQDVYMLGGNQHKLTLYHGFILNAISYGASGKDIESKWDVAQGDDQGDNLEGFVDNGAYRYVLDHKIAEKGNTWEFYRVLTPTATIISNELEDLTTVRVDYTHGPDVGFWAHQNSLRSSDDSVHFGFKTPVMSFIGGDLSINNNIAPNLSASLVEGMSMSNSIGLDYHFDVMGFSVSPQMELAWTRFDFDDFTGPGSTGKVSLEDGDIITSRFGLLFEGDHIYGGVNLRTAIDGKTSVNVSGVSITSEEDDLLVDGLLGFSYDWSEDYETYGEFFMDADEVRASLGVRIDF